MAKDKITPVILAGGKGTRLWPLSREDTPKQFCKLQDGLSLFQHTIDRVREGLRFTAPVIVTGSAYVDVVQRQIEEVGIRVEAIVSEPVGKDTSAAILLALEVAGTDRPYVVMPSDHEIGDTEVFFKAIDQARDVALDSQKIVTFGIVPVHPDTGLGYLRAGEKLGTGGVRHLQCFVEKPDLATAEVLIQEKDIFWNAGIFLFDAETARTEFKRCAAAVFDAVSKSVQQGTWIGRVFHPDCNKFLRCPAISFDYAVMEKTGHAAMIPMAPMWSDLGSWKAIWETSVRDDDENVVGENCYVTTTNDCLVHSEGPVVGVAGLSDVVVVASKDAVLVTSRSNPQHVKTLVENMKEAEVSAATQHPGEDRPWGRFDSLDFGGSHQVKRIRVDPGQRLSLQYHHHRAEHWVVVKGIATVTVGQTVTDLTVGEQIFIPKGAVHRLDNFTDQTVEIIEVQIGSYLGEDDIVRVEDIYGRPSTTEPNENIAA